MMRKFEHESRTILAWKQGEVGDGERFCFLCRGAARDTQERGTGYHPYERPPVLHAKLKLADRFRNHFLHAPTKYELIINLKTAKTLGLPCRRRCFLVPTR
jgi:hypothetical protein